VPVVTVAAAVTVTAAVVAAVAVVGRGVRIVHVCGVLARAVVSIAGRGVATVVLAVGLTPPNTYGCSMSHQDRMGG
jgi:hypothetical protein